MQFEFNSLKEDKAEVEEQIKAYELKIDELQARLEEEFDTDYIMRIAREKLNFRLPEEIIFYNDLSK
jgi:cell division protein FtsB